MCVCVCVCVCADIRAILFWLVREGKICLDTYGQLSEPYARMYRLISDRLVQIKYLNSAYQGFFYDCGYTGKKSNSLGITHSLCSFSSHMKQSWKTIYMSTWQAHWEGQMKQKCVISIINEWQLQMLQWAKQVPFADRTTKAFPFSFVLTITPWLLVALAQQSHSWSAMNSV